MWQTKHNLPIATGTRQSLHANACILVCPQSTRNDITNAIFPINKSCRTVNGVLCQSDQTLPLAPLERLAYYEPTFRDTECTGKSPDPLYLHDGDAIHPVLIKGVWDRDFSPSWLAGYPKEKERERYRGRGGGGRERNKTVVIDSIHVSVQLWTLIQT